MPGPKIEKNGYFLGNLSHIYILLVSAWVPHSLSTPKTCVERFGSIILGLFMFTIPPPNPKTCYNGTSLQNAKNRVFGGQEANYNQDSILGPKGGASQSLPQGRRGHRAAPSPGATRSMTTSTTTSPSPTQSTRRCIASNASKNAAGAEAERDLQVHGLAPLALPRPQQGRLGRRVGHGASCLSAPRRAPRTEPAASPR